MRKYNGSYTIPIKKHTKVRRPMSIYFVKLVPFESFILQSGSSSLSLQLNPIVVNDISKVQKNSYDISQDKHYCVEDTTWYKQQNRSMFRPAGYPRPMGNWFGDTIKEQFDDMRSPSYFVVNKEQAKKIKQYNKAIKPSLWQRIKRKGRR